VTDSHKHKTANIDEQSVNRFLSWPLKFELKTFPSALPSFNPSKIFCGAYFGVCFLQIAKGLKSEGKFNSVGVFPASSRPKRHECINRRPQVVNYISVYRSTRIKQTSTLVAANINSLSLFDYGNGLNIWN
jgi:hypothetical protein